MYFLMDVGGWRQILRLGKEQYNTEIIIDAGWRLLEKTGDADVKLEESRHLGRMDVVITA